MWDLQRKKNEYRVVKPSKDLYLPPGIISALLTFRVPNCCYSLNPGYPSTKPGGSGMVISSGQKPLHIISVLSDHVVQPVPIVAACRLLTRREMEMVLVKR